MPLLLKLDIYVQDWNGPSNLNSLVLIPILTCILIKYTAFYELCAAARLPH